MDLNYRTMSLPVVVLYADGRYEETTCDSDQAFPSILQCERVIQLMPRSDITKTFKYDPVSDIKCYMGDGALSDGTPSMINDWIEFLYALGLVDNTIGCIIGEVIITGCPSALLEEIEAYHDVVTQGDSHQKWSRIKTLTVEYGRLKACQWRNCDNENCKNHCGKCKSVMYCSRECQIKDWPFHKEDCFSVTEDACKQQ